VPPGAARTPVATPLHPGHTESVLLLLLLMMMMKLMMMLMLVCVCVWQVLQWQGVTVFCQLLIVVVMATRSP